MSKQYDNNNSGVLFKNEKKTDPKHPDYTGSLEIGGKEFWQSAWIKKSKAGKTFMSFAYTPKEEQQGRTAQQPPSSDDIPW
jgi:uncharacterized protein (DUF736 family)